MGPHDTILELAARAGIRDTTSASWRNAQLHNYLGGNELYSLPNRKANPRQVTETIEMDISSRFGRRVRMLRQERNLTQTEMAKRFGIDRSYISDLERGRKSISLPMLEVIALGMKISISTLFEDL